MKKKTFSKWVSQSGKTEIIATLVSESNQQYFPGKRMIIHIKHNYGDYWFGGRLRNNTGEQRLYSKSDRLSYGLKMGIEYWSKHF